MGSIGQIIMEDDNSGLGGINSKIVTTLDPGTYSIISTSAGKLVFNTFAQSVI